MDLLTILISGVGSGIAKGILNVWLEEYNTEKEIAKNIIGILASKTKDVLAQRSGARQFEEISDKVAKNLIPLFDAVDDSLTEKEKIDVAQMAGHAVKSLKIDPELLLSHNLNPSNLEESLLSFSYYPNEESLSYQFSDDQKKLYQIVLSEAAQYIVDIASTLPSFTEKTFAEVLNRQNSIIERADRIFEEVKRMRDQDQSDDEAAKQFEMDYRRSIVRKLDYLQLFGVDLSSSSERYKLSVAYVTLSVEYTSQSDDEEIEESELITIDEAIQRSSRLLVRGPAGSGKTTLLQWIAVMTGGYNLKGDLEEWNTCVPFFIRLRQFSDKELPKPEEFPSLVAPAISGNMPSGWVHQKLIRGEAIILIDGLDELVEKQRRDVREWLKGLEETFPEVRYLMTTRPYAAKKGWLDDMDFMEAYLQDMNVKDVSSFIEHWHDAVKDEENNNGKKIELDELEKKLIQVVKTNRNIRKLATSPLLCAMICALHRDRLTQLPTYRVGLYDACIDMFLRRDQERNVPLNDYQNIGDPQKIKLLSDFAYWLIKNGWTEVGVEKADRRFDQKLSGLKDIPIHTTGAGVRRYFVERSGILRQPTLKEIDFPHRTFEEFLAAKAATEEGDIGVLVEHAKDDQWREVIILACGLARPIEVNKIILDLIKKGDECPQSESILLYLLATSCSEISIELPKNTTTIIEKRLSKFLPPKDLTMAKQIAGAGDIVLPYLSPYGYIGTKELLPTIRSLAIIGSEYALSILKRHTDDTRISIQEALISGLKYNENPEEYSQRVLFNVKEIILDRKFPIDSLEHMHKLDTIHIKETGLIELLPEKVKNKISRVILKANSPSEFYLFNQLFIKYKIDPTKIGINTFNSIKRMIRRNPRLRSMLMLDEQIQGEDFLEILNKIMSHDDPTRPNCDLAPFKLLPHVKEIYFEHAFMDDIKDIFEMNLKGVYFFNCVYPNHQVLELSRKCMVNKDDYYFPKYFDNENLTSRWP